MNLGVGALLLRSELILQASLRPKLALLRLSRPAFVTRAASTSVTRLEPQRQQSRPTPDERLTSLRSAEKRSLCQYCIYCVAVSNKWSFNRLRIAVLAAGSLVVGYITLKVAFSGIVLHNIGGYTHCVYTYLPTTPPLNKPPQNHFHLGTLLQCMAFLC